MLINTVAFPCRQAASASAQPRATAARGEGLQLTIRGKSNNRDQRTKRRMGSKTFEVDAEEARQFSTVLLQLRQGQRLTNTGEGHVTSALDA